MRPIDSHSADQNFVLLPDEEDSLRKRLQGTAENERGSSVCVAVYMMRTVYGKGKGREEQERGGCCWGQQKTSEVVVLCA